MARTKKTKAVTTLRNRAPKRNVASERGVLYDARAIQKVERRYQIVEMRRKGYSTLAISQALDVSVSLVCSELKDVLYNVVKLTEETVEEARSLQTERLDEMLKAVYPFAIEAHKEVRVGPDGEEVIIEIPPDPRYVAAALGIEDRRARLLALNVPEQKELKITGIREYVGISLDEV